MMKNRFDYFLLLCQIVKRNIHSKNKKKRNEKK